jgi:enoyl-CoA hydratase
VFEITQNGEIAVITMIHGKANTMDLEFCEGIAARFKELEKSDAKAVVLTSRGKIFSAGVNLVRALDGGANYFREFLPALSKAFEAIFFFRKPVVAAINGHAIAGGSVLACCADRRMMATDAGRTGVPELAVGVPFPTMAIEIMRFSVSHCHFQEIVLGAGTYTPMEALSRGLIDEVVEPHDLMKRALAVARGFAAVRHDAFSVSKKQIRQPVADRYRSESQRFEEEINGLWCAPDAFARIRDYVSHTIKKA